MLREVATIERIKSDFCKAVELIEEGASKDIIFFDVKKGNIHLEFQNEKYTSKFEKYAIHLIDFSQNENRFIFPISNLKKLTAANIIVTRKTIDAHIEIFKLLPSIFQSYAFAMPAESEYVITAYRLKHYKPDIANKLNSSLQEEFDISSVSDNETVSIFFPKKVLLNNLTSLKQKLQKIEWEVTFSNIHHAAVAGNIPAIKFFLDQGVSVNDFGPRNETPLHYAASNGNIEAMKFLLEHGANINALSTKNITPLCYAAFLGYNDAVKFLLDKKAMLDLQDFQGQTLLHVLAKTQHIETIKIVLDSGANINARDHENQTPLHYAINCGHTKTALFLLEKGANFNLEDHDGATPLLLASSLGNIEVVTYLLQKDADVNQHRGRKTVFRHAPQILPIHGKHFFISRIEADTPLHWASAQENLELGEILIRHGADINIKDNESNTPLHHAAGKGALKFVDFLISHGADFSLRGYLEMTPLEFALFNERENVVAFFITKSVTKLIKLIIENNEEDFKDSPKKDPFQFNIVEIDYKKITLFFEEENTAKLFSQYMNILTLEDVGATENRVVFSVNSLKKIVVQNLEEKYFLARKKLKNQHEVFNILSAHLQSRGIEPILNNDFIVYTYKLEKHHVNSVQKLNSAIQPFGGSAFYVKSFLKLKLPQKIFEDIGPLKDVFSKINWQVNRLDIKPAIAITTYKKENFDDIARQEELLRRESERKAKTKEKQKEEIEFEENLKTQMSSDSISDIDEEAPYDNFLNLNEIEENLPKENPTKKEPIYSFRDFLDVCDDKRDGIKLIRDEKEKGKEKEKQKEKKKMNPKRKKMSLFEFQKLAETASPSSSGSSSSTHGYRAQHQNYSHEEKSKKYKS